MFLEQNWSSANYFKIVLKDSITVAILLPTLRKFHASALLSLLQEPAPGLTGVCNPPCHTQATPWPRCRQCWDLQFCTPIITAHQWPHQGVQGSAMRMRTPLPRTLAFSAFHAAQRLPGRQLCSFFSHEQNGWGRMKDHPEGKVTCQYLGSLIFYGQNCKNLICLLPQESEISLSLGGFSMSLKKETNTVM